jgi:hypothetical protein
LCIEKYAIYVCSSLSSICLPSELVKLGNSGLVAANLRDISIAEGNCHFKVCGNFLFDFDCVSLKRYFGNAKELMIANNVETIGGGCFKGCEDLLHVIFESGSQVSCIESYAFCQCSLLSSICIPSSVEKLCKSCFYNCGSLSTLTFESNSKLSCLEKSALRDCSSHSSIYIPSSVD